MTTLTLNINEKTEKGKALLAFLKAFYEEKEMFLVAPKTLREVFLEPLVRFTMKKIQTRCLTLLNIPYNLG